MEFLTLFVFQFPILSCLGLIHLYYIRPICVISVVVFFAIEYPGQQEFHLLFAL
jgi:hypothetical protein